MMCQRIGRPPISIMGLGRRVDSSLIRDPSPPARMTTFKLASTMRGSHCRRFSTQGSSLKRLFLTGAQGFVGQWVQRMAAPIEERHGYRLAIPPRGFELLDAAHLDAQLAEHRPDAILHLAGQSNVPESFKDPAGTFRTNVLGTLQLLEAIKRSGLAPRMVMPSSGEVYGLVPDEQMPIGEDRMPKPCNPYAVS